MSLLMLQDIQTPTFEKRNKQYVCRAKATNPLYGSSILQQGHKKCDENGFQSTFIDFNPHSLLL